MEWISVKDRLPESGVHVLLCCEMHRHGGGRAEREVDYMAACEARRTGLLARFLYAFGYRIGTAGRNVKRKELFNMKENKHGFEPKKEEVYTAEEPRSVVDIMTTEIALRPSYWASVSGGKDSLYMLNFILHNLDRYPLDGVVHFELEIDYPFIHDVIDYMESECKRFGIRFVRIKPRKTWEELYYSFSKTGRMRGFPMRKARWCNSAYKLDAKRQLSEWLNSLGYYIIDYIGYCADEERRFNKRLTAQKAERYPLAENGITEDGIWEWAKTQPIFNHYYETNKRCGCMYCPMSSYLNYAYLCKYYPDNFSFMIEKMRETERLRETELGRPFSVISSNPKYNADYLETIIKTKWLKKLNEMEVRD